MTTLKELESRLRPLEDVHLITQLQYRYFRLVDQRDWEALRDCFTADASTHFENGHYVYSGIDQVLKFLSESLDGLVADGRYPFHLGHHPEIELLDATEASGRWALLSPMFEPATGHVGFHEAFYEMVYRKEGEEWRIARIGHRNYAHARFVVSNMELAWGEEIDSRDLNASVRS